MKLKIKPSEKIKRRYILIDGTKKNIEDAILEYIGILGWAKASPVFVESKKALKGEILSVSRKEISNVLASFEIFKKKLKVKKVSGTLKSLTK